MDRAVEDCPGPVVSQEFSQFETSTQAHNFATSLNEGLDIPASEALQIVTSASLRTGELLCAMDSSGPLRNQVPGRSIRVQYILAELDLAFTFCRIVRCKPSQHTKRMLRNARNARFNAMHFVCQVEMAACDVEAIAARVEKLRTAFQEFAQEPFSKREDLALASAERHTTSLQIQQSVRRARLQIPR